MIDDDTKPRYGSVYARCYNDGLRAAGVTNPYEVPFLTSKATKDERSYKSQQSLIQLIDKAASGQANAESIPAMNAKKFESTYQGLTSIAKKVFDVCPIAEPWPINKIVSEMARQGSNQDHRVVLGAIRDLCGRKLVHEVSTGMYQRIKIEAKPIEKKSMTESAPTPKAKPADVVAIKATPKKKGPMELLAELASKARQFAEELDNAALEIEQEFQNSEAKSEQLKQLKSLLKGIAD